MVFGLFGKKSNKETFLDKGKKLAAQGRIAEAMTYFQDALEADSSCEEAAARLKEARLHLVNMNLEEAESYRTADPEKAAELAKLALELAGDDMELIRRAGDVLGHISKSAPKPPPKKEEPKRLFEPSCGCGTDSCDSDCDEKDVYGEERRAEGDEDFHEDPDDLFFFYLESADPEEKAMFENLGPSFRRAYVALQQGDGEEAGRWLGKARTEESHQTPIFYCAAMLAWFKGDGNTANRLLWEAVRTSPDFGPALKRRATLMREAGQPAEAVALLEERVRNKPEDKDALTIYATALAEAGRGAEAIEVFGPYAGTAMKTNPELATLWAHILLSQAKTDEAITALRIAVTLQPNAVDAQEILGIQLTRRGGREAEGAVRCFKQCYRVNPEKGWYYLLRISDAYAAMGLMKEASSFLEESRRELPENEEALKIWESVATGLAQKR